MMNALSIINRVKYSKNIFKIYNFLGSKLITLLKFFLRADDHLIIFASFGGRKYDDSPKAIYEAMLDDCRFDTFKLVWAFMKPEEYELSRGEKVKIDTLQYYKTLLKARVWVTNSSLTRGLNFRGINSFELNTWHGSTIKLMGCDISEKSKSFKLKGKKLQRSLMLAQGQYDVKIFSRAFQRSVESFRIVGLPRNDELAYVQSEKKNLLKKKFGIAANKKVILYAPTYREYDRDSGHNCVMTLPIDIKKWKEKLGNDYVLLFRAHYEVARVMGIQNDTFVKNVSSYSYLNELMIVSDILISDYSSIFFDYAILGKPMLCYCYDYDKYTEERGLYFDIREWLQNADNEDDLIKLVLRTDTTIGDVATKRFQEEFVTEYGSASQKSLDIIYNYVTK